MFDQELSQDIQNPIASTEKILWEEIDNHKLKEECKKVEEWILDLDLGHTVHRVSLYE